MEYSSKTFEVDNRSITHQSEREKSSLDTENTQQDKKENKGITNTGSLAPLQMKQYQDMANKYCSSIAQNRKINRTGDVNDKSNLKISYPAVQFFVNTKEKQSNDDNKDSIANSDSIIQKAGFDLTPEELFFSKASVNSYKLSGHQRTTKSGSRWFKILYGDKSFSLHIHLVGNESKTTIDHSHDKIAHGTKEFYVKLTDAQRQKTRELNPF